MTNLKEAFGARVKEMRKMRGMTQEELAEHLEVNPRQLTRIECGENFASAETLAKLSTALNVELSVLFDFEWSENVTLLATGTEGASVLRLVQKDEKVRVMAPYNKFKEMDMPKQMDVTVTESVMINIAQKTKKPITVEYFNDKTRKYVKTYYPNGKVEVNISEQNIQSEDIQLYIKEKMKNYSSDVEKLEFIKLATDAINDPSALNELKILIKGMELAHRLK